ncbi:nucleolar protein 16 [Leisingera aquimarina]|nr:nucleolar protein 16 [Leisingera aquimarina]
MQTLSQSYRGLGLLVRLNWDRALTGFAVLGALTAGAWLAAL